MKKSLMFSFLAGFITCAGIAGVLIGLTSCSSNQTTNETGLYSDSTNIRIIYNRFSYSVSVIKVDGCEYILYSGDKKGGIVHKQNCSNHSKIKPGTN